MYLPFSFLGCHFWFAKIFNQTLKMLAMWKMQKQMQKLSIVWDNRCLKRFLKIHWFCSRLCVFISVSQIVNLVFCFVQLWRKLPEIIPRYQKRWCRFTLRLSWHDEDASGSMSHIIFSYEFWIYLSTLVFLSYYLTFFCMVCLSFWFFYGLE